MQGRPASSRPRAPLPAAPPCLALPRVPRRSLFSLLINYMLFVVVVSCAVALFTNDVRAVPSALMLSRAAGAVIWQNIAFSVATKVRPSAARLPSGPLPFGSLLAGPGQGDYPTVGRSPPLPGNSSDAPPAPGLKATPPHLLPASSRLLASVFNTLLPVAHPLLVAAQSCCRGAAPRCRLIVKLPHPSASPCAGGGARPGHDGPLYPLGGCSDGRRLGPAGRRECVEVRACAPTGRSGLAGGGLAPPLWRWQSCLKGVGWGRR